MPYYVGGGSQVGSAEITDGAIVNADINSAAAIALTKLAGADGSGYNSSIINPNLVVYTKLEITAAQMLTLVTGVPRVILAAQGATTAILPVSFAVEVRGGTTNYINGGGLNLGLSGIAAHFFTNNAGAAAITGVVGLRHYGADHTPLAIQELRNKDLEFRNVSATAFITGDRLVTIHVWYRLITTS